MLDEALSWVGGGSYSIAHREQEVGGKAKSGALYLVSIWRTLWIRLFNLHSDPLQLGRSRKTKNYISQNPLQLKTWLWFRFHQSEVLAQELCGERRCRANMLLLWTWQRWVALESAAVVAAFWLGKKFPDPGMGSSRGSSVLGCGFVSSFWKHTTVNFFSPPSDSVNCLLSCFLHLNPYWNKEIASKDSEQFWQQTATLGWRVSRWIGCWWWECL